MFREVICIDGRTPTKDTIYLPTCPVEIMFPSSAKIIDHELSLGRTKEGVNVIPLRFLSDDIIRSGGGGGQKGHALTLNVRLADFFFKKLKQTPPNLVTFPKINLATIWCDFSWSKQFDVSMAIAF